MLLPTLGCVRKKINSVLSRRSADTLKVRQIRNSSMNEQLVKPHLSVAFMFLIPKR